MRKMSEEVIRRKREFIESRQKGKSSTKEVVVQVVRGESRRRKFAPAKLISSIKVKKKKVQTLEVSSNQFSTTNGLEAEGRKCPGKSAKVIWNMIRSAR
jgi:transcriptional regulator NrdR family protein